MSIALGRTRVQMSSVLTLACMVCLLAWTMLAVGCNTTQGAGKDIERMGEGIQDAAD